MQTLRWAALAALTTLPALAGSQIQGGGKNLSWPGGKVSLKISRTVHTADGAAGVSTRESAASVHRAVADAAMAWARSGRGAVEVELGFTDEQLVTGGVNLVTFTDPAPFDSGLCDRETYISCTLVAFDEAGAITGASVAFNPYKRYSSIGLDGTHDIGLIMMHEMGHVLGLNHSFVADSVMVAEAEQEPAPGAPRMFPLRRLSEDDLSTLAMVYPAGPVSGIAGRVARAGSPVAGARVLALDTLGRVPHGAVTGEDGLFRLPLGAGDYVVIAEPPDGPGTLVPGAIKVGEGELVEGVVLAAPPAGPRLTVENVGVVAGGTYAGLPRVDLARGRDHSFALTRLPAGAPVELILPEPAVTSAGALSVPAAAPQLVRQAIRVDARAPAGSYAFAARAGLAFAVAPGSMRVTSNPRVERIEAEDAPGVAVTELRAGRRYRLRGTDLSAGTLSQAPELFFGGAPWPSQLGAMAVRVGDRWAPLVSVAPEEIVFEAPGGLEPGETQVAAVAGTMTESAPVTVGVALE